MPFRLTLFLCLLMLPLSLRAAQKPVVWFDQAHGQAFRIDRQGPLHLTDFARLLIEQGSVAETSRQPLDSGMLDKAEALVLSGAFRPYSEAEIDAVMDFLRRGGRLAVMLHIAPPVGTLLHRLGVDFSNGVIREQDRILGGDPLNFRVVDLAAHPVLAGLRGFNIYGGWALTNTGSGCRIIARTGPRAWVDLDRNRRLNRGDAMQRFGVAVAGTLGKGGFIIFADDAIFQNRFLAANRRLAVNLARWLLGKPTQNRQVAQR
ncbi:hypothetical protein EDC39_10362 [Geothermobacter ehrlichii]|uniref:DUF4350 domain-containing protein n=1 Tax=Geothermobacter ehrlichii TaxID=213224 RepID=A0A5D3WNI5_9BACT|nr:DUF4350 domain-containing protein [Geothermobacter ehrlichii]TYO99219.1 hypothetical protein EDC39_10362 [Geothermobacter ehrlichii]